LTAFSGPNLTRTSAGAKFRQLAGEDSGYK